MRMFDILAKKRDGGELTAEEIAFWITGCVRREIPDYQTTALLMAGRIRGFSLAETVEITNQMRYSGTVLNLETIPGIKADKHSSGGVGDKTSLIVMPIVAAAGLKVAKLSGRGLGHTGGTVDKLESFAGFRGNLSSREFMQQITEIGMAISGQSADLDPADKILYGLRDVTATVDSIPLIAASIMSKKLATGADILALDVKYGSGALLQDIAESRKLAQLMVQLAQSAGKKASALLTSMDQPLGWAVGNALEMAEVGEVLQGGGSADLRQLSLALAGELLWLAGVETNRGQACHTAEKLLDGGEPFHKLQQMLAVQGGDSDFNHLPKANLVLPFCADEEGYITAIDTALVGYASLALGAGRTKAEEQIDYSAGIVFQHKCGAYLRQGEIIAQIHCQNQQHYQNACVLLKQAVHFGVAPVVQPTLIAEIISTEKK